MTAQVPHPRAALPALERALCAHPHSPAPPTDLFAHPVLAPTLQGINPALVWDSHAHLVGTGDSGEGPQSNPVWTSWRAPLRKLERRAMMKAAGCLPPSKGVDHAFVEHLALMVSQLPQGNKVLLFAFDWLCDERGTPQEHKSSFFIPDHFAQGAARAHPTLFEWAASIHPYRCDALARLDAALQGGAKAIKWLPAAQNIDPDAPVCAPFFASLARANLPLIVHTGAEKVTLENHLEHLGHPHKLRRALDAGVRVVAAHCASSGRDLDPQTPGKKAPSFDLLISMMEQPQWREHLFGDISGLTLINHRPRVIKTLLARPHLHHRLLNGTDYPLPGIPQVMSPTLLWSQGLLPRSAIGPLKGLRQRNPLAFDFALKRLLSWQGHKFGACVFETRAFFDPSLPA